MYIGSGEEGPRYLGFSDIPNYTTITMENNQLFHDLKIEKCFDNFSEKVVVVDMYCGQPLRTGESYKVYYEANPDVLKTVTDKCFRDAYELGKEVTLVTVRPSIIQPQYKLEPVFEKYRKHRMVLKRSNLKVIVIDVENAHNDIDVFKAENNGVCFMFDEVLTIID